MVHLPYYDTKRKGWCRNSRQLGVHASNSSTPEEEANAKWVSVNLKPALPTQ